MIAQKQRVSFNSEAGPEGSSLISLCRGAALANAGRLMRHSYAPRGRKRIIRNVQSFRATQKPKLPPVVKPMFPPARTPTLTPKMIALESIAECVAAVFGFSVKELASGNRQRQIAYARRAYCVLARAMTGRSFSAIGQCVGMHDHSSVHHATKSHEKTMRDYDEYASRFNMAEAELKSMT